MDVFPKYPDAETVIGRNQSGIIPLPQQGNDPLFHLPGRLIGEGDAKNIRRIDPQILHNVGIAMRQRLGLTRTSPRNHAHITFRRLHSLQLFPIQSRQNQIFRHSMHTSLRTQLFSARCISTPTEGTLWCYTQLTGKRYFLSRRLNAGTVPSRISTMSLLISSFSMLPDLYEISNELLLILAIIICSASQAIAIFGL